MSLVVLELERAERVRDPFDGVGQAVGEVVERVEAPRVAAAVVRRVADPQQQRIAHDHVRVREVDLRAQHVRAVGELARLHAAQQVEVLVGRPIAIRARDAWRRDRAAVRADLLFRLRIDVRLAALHEVFGDLVQLLEVVAGVELGVPLEAEPFDVALDGLDVLDVFGERDWCRRSGDCSARRTPARCRSSGRRT